VLLPSATLHAVPFLAVNEQLINGAHALVFPSPFSVSSSFHRCITLRTLARRRFPLIGVIGQGSYQTLLETIEAGGWAKEQFQIIANAVEPFDAEHLAPLLAQALNNSLVMDADASTLPCNVVLLNGDKTNHDAVVWKSWLNSHLSNLALARSLTVTEVLAYENRFNEAYVEIMKETMPLDWCKSDSAVYFSSSLAVRSFSKALLSSIDSKVNFPLAITIHPKISQEVRLHLGWNVVEIPVGPQALLHWMSKNSI
jgi:uroporphyrinogen-III synthase